MTFSCQDGFNGELISEMLLNASFAEVDPGFVVVGSFVKGDLHICRAVKPVATVVGQVELFRIKKSEVSDAIADHFVVKGKTLPWLFGL
jgi:hypothetical protein